MDVIIKFNEKEVEKLKNISKSITIQHYDLKNGELNIDELFSFIEDLYSEVLDRDEIIEDLEKEIRELRERC